MRACSRILDKHAPRVAYPINCVCNGCGGAGPDLQVRERRSRLPRLAELSGMRISPLAFEKDDDTNFHMDFIRSFANLRARNYSIEEVDALQVRLLIG